MKVAMHNWMRPEPIETTIKRLAKYGYDAIEISYDSVELSPGAPGTKAVAGMLKDNGIECVGSISLMFAGRDLIHADPAVRASSVDYLKSCITMIKELRDGADGPGTMSIVPSEVGKVKEMDTPEQEWAWAVEGLKEVNAHANAEGVRIAIEALNRFETNFINRHDQALLLAQEVGDDVGVCLDVYHMNQEEADVLQAFRNAADRLFDVHVADNNRMACGQGQLPWADIREIAVPHHVGVLRQWDAGRGQGGVGRLEQAQLNAGRMCRVDREIHSQARPGRTQGVRLTWPDSHIG